MVRNFLTIHGKSNFAGLSVWTNEGEKMTVKVPSGCLLIQAGKQIEHLTAGHVKAGFHEVGPCFQTDAIRSRLPHVPTNDCPTLQADWPRPTECG